MAIIRCISWFLILSGYLTGCATTPGTSPVEEAPDPARDTVAAPDPADAQAQYRHGNMLFDAGRYAEAAEAYRAALALEPQFASAYTNLGLSLKRLGLLDEASAAYDEALRLQPDDVVTLRNRRVLAEVMNDGPRYADCVRRLAELLPEDPSAMRDMAGLLLAEESYAEAAGLYERLTFFGQTDADLFYNLGLCHFRLERMAAAEAAWKEALQGDARHAAANRGLAFLYWNTGDYTQAWSLVSRCRRLDIGLDPDFLDMLREDSGKRTAL